MENSTIKQICRDIERLSNNYVAKVRDDAKVWQDTIRMFYTLLDVLPYPSYDPMVHTSLELLKIKNTIRLTEELVGKELKNILLKEVCIPSISKPEFANPDLYLNIKLEPYYTIKDLCSLYGLYDISQAEDVAWSLSNEYKQKNIR